MHLLFNELFLPWLHDVILPTWRTSSRTTWDVNRSYFTFFSQRTLPHDYVLITFKNCHSFPKSQTTNYEGDFLCGKLSIHVVATKRDNVLTATNKTSTSRPCSIFGMCVSVYSLYFSQLSNVYCAAGSLAWRDARQSSTLSLWIGPISTLVQEMSLLLLDGISVE